MDCGSVQYQYVLVRCIVRRSQQESVDFNWLHPWADARCQKALQVSEGNSWMQRIETCISCTCIFIVNWTGLGGTERGFKVVLWRWLDV